MGLWIAYHLISDRDFKSHIVNHLILVGTSEPVRKSRLIQIGTLERVSQIFFFLIYFSSERYKTLNNCGSSYKNKTKKERENTRVPVLNEALNRTIKYFTVWFSVALGTKNQIFFFFSVVTTNKNKNSLNALCSNSFKFNFLKIPYDSAMELETMLRIFKFFIIPIHSLHSDDKQ